MVFLLHIHICIRKDRLSLYSQWKLLCCKASYLPLCVCVCSVSVQLDDPSVFPAVIVEQVPAADLLHVYSGLDSDEVPNGIMVDATLHVVEEPSILVGGVDLSGRVRAVRKQEHCVSEAFQNKKESHVGEFVFVSETTVSGGEDSMETSEAAAALLNMESPNNILDEKRMSKFISSVHTLLLNAKYSRFNPPSF